MPSPLTSVHNALVMQINDGRCDCPDDVCCISGIPVAGCQNAEVRLERQRAHSLLVVAAPLADAVKQLAPNAQISNEVEVVHCLKVVDQCHN